MENTLEIFFDIYNSFPEAYNWQKYLRLKNWKKLYFNMFIKKYWLNWDKTKYSGKDVIRRIRMIEFFKYITLNFDVSNDENWRSKIETRFFRMVIIELKNKKLELLSFYNFR